ncbi:MAG: hypothetical protein GC160_10225 [Acidobacteria bacterium]|nr:hypothetical protein [Acidobacteriota bacterium]
MRSLVLVLLALAACSQPKTEEPFTIVMLPDTQLYSEKNPSIFHDQTRWTAEHVGEENIVFVTHVGDIVQNFAERPEEWEVADAAMKRLDGLVPWGVAIGNHDYDRNPDNPRQADKFVEVFGPQRFAGRSWFGGATENGLNSYQLFTGGGREFLIFHLESDIPDDTIAWAESILREHPDTPAIVTTHIYLDDRTNARTAEPYLLGEAGNSGEAIYQKLIRRNPQIFLVLCGHWATAGGEWFQASPQEGGSEVFEVLADYQTRENGGDGWLRVIRFDPAGGRIWFKTYSPTLDQHESDENSEFVFFVDFDQRFGKR